MPRLCAVILVLLLCVACNRSGLSRPFRQAARDAQEKLHAAGESWGKETVESADAAVQIAKTKVHTNADLKASNVLDWYAILLHRHDLQRTENWRKLCGTEVELYLSGRDNGSTELWNGYKYENVGVTRGACEQGVVQMMKQDCDNLIATRNFRPSDCSLLQASSDPAK